MTLAGLNGSASQAEIRQQGDGQLWLAALLLSLLFNGGLLVVAGWVGLMEVEWGQAVEPTVHRQSEAAATVYLEAFEPEPEPVAVPESKPQFTRTSEDQQAVPEEKTPRIGERSTRATSDRVADPQAEALPSQAGVEPEPEQDIETTESRYQDGRLDEPRPPTPATPGELAPPTPAQAAAVDPAVAAAPPRTPQPIDGTDDRQGLPPPRERLLEGPDPMDVQVPREVAVDQPPVARPRKVEPSPELQPPKPVVVANDPPKPVPLPEKSFQGYQRKTAVIGSISRTGRSALDVEDSELGRYQAKISRAVEQEWQRNCVRHRDFITPGFLTVRFFVEPSGKVRSVQFVGDMETGEVQKGFTLNSIRDAPIPPMPAPLKQSYADEPLELIFRFYF